MKDPIKVTLDIVIGQDKEGKYYTSVDRWDDGIGFIGSMGMSGNDTHEEALKQVALDATQLISEISLKPGGDS